MAVCTTSIGSRFDGYSSICQLDRTDHRSSIYLVEGSGVVEATVPDFVHYLSSLDIILAFGSVFD